MPIVLSGNELGMRPVRSMTPVSFAHTDMAEAEKTPHHEIERFQRTIWDDRPRGALGPVGRRRGLARHGASGAYLRSEKQLQSADGSCMHSNGSIGFLRCVLRCVLRCCAVADAQYAPRQATGKLDHQAVAFIIRGSR